MIVVELKPKGRSFSDGPLYLNRGKTTSKMECASKYNSPSAAKRARDNHQAKHAAPGEVFEYAFYKLIQGGLRK